MDVKNLEQKFVGDKKSFCIQVEAIHGEMQDEKREQEALFAFTHSPFN